MVQVIPYRLFLKLSWDSRRGGLLHSPKDKKNPLRRYLENRRVGIAFMPLLPFEIVDWGSVVDWSVIPARKSVQSEKNRSFWLENRLGLGQSLQNHDMVGPFHHFGKFFVFHSFDERFFLAEWHILTPSALSTNGFIFWWQFADLARAMTKSHAFIITRTVGGSGF